MDTHDASASPKFRYLETKYVEDFFSRGELLLTTYARCRSIEDLARRDAREGKANYFFTHGGIATAGIQVVGARSYMLCTSQTFSRTLMERFKADRCIRILDADAFANCVSKQLPGFVQLQMGACRYVPERFVSRELQRPIVPDHMRLIRAADGSGDKSVDDVFEEMQFEMSQALDEQLGDTAYFVKEAEPFAQESEFRMVWTVDREVTWPMLVTCPDAIRYCQRVEVLSYR